MRRITLVRLILAIAILIVLGAGMAIVANNLTVSSDGAPARFVH